MELIVLDAKGKVGTAVSAALPQVNVTVVTDVDALGAQLKSCTVQPSTLLFVNQSDLSACSDLAARLPAIYWAQENYTADELLQAIRIGARDIWRVSDVPTEWIASLERLQDATAGFAHWANEMQRDAQTAGNIQQGMWPADATDLAGYRFSRRLLPAATLTGDFVDYFPIGVRYLTFFVADVAGHRRSASLDQPAIDRTVCWYACGYVFGCYRSAQAYASLLVCCAFSTELGGGGRWPNQEFGAAR